MIFNHLGIKKIKNFDEMRLKFPDDVRA